MASLIEAMKLLAGKRAKDVIEAQGGSMLYKWAPKPKELMMNPQTSFPVKYDWNEPWKPVGKYWAEDFGSTTIAQGPKESMALSQAKEMADKTVRGVLPDNAKVANFTQDQLRTKYAQMVRKEFEAQGLKGEALQDAIHDASGTSEVINRYREAFTKNLLASGYGFVRVHGVDGVPGASEIIQLKPQTVPAFWKDKTALLGVGGTALLPLMGDLTKGGVNE